MFMLTFLYACGDRFKNYQPKVASNNFPPFSTDRSFLKLAEEEYEGLPKDVCQLLRVLFCV